MDLDAKEAATKRPAGKSDGDLLRDYVVDDDQDAFTALVDRYHHMVYSSCLRRLGGNAGLAAEAAQAVYVILGRKAASLTSRSDLGGWLYCTARGVSINVYRGEKRRQRREGEAVARELTFMGGDEGEHPGLRRAELRAAFDAAIDELSVQEQRIIRCHYFLSQSFDEIAVRANLSCATIRQKAHRARKKLRRILTRRGLAISLTALTAMLEEVRAEGASVSGVRYQVSAREASETARGLAERVMWEMAWHWRLKVAGVAAGALILGLGIAWLVGRHGATESPSHAWRVASVTGAVEGIGIGQALRPGDVIRTGVRQEVELRFGAGSRLLLREEGEIQYPVSNKKPPMTPLGFRLEKGALVAALEGAVRFQTEHGVVESGEDGATFRLMVAESTNAFTRVDVTAGSVEGPGPRGEERIDSGNALCFGPGIEGKVTAADRHEFSPKYGGVFYRRYAQCYRRGKWALDEELEAIGEAASIRPEQLVEGWYGIEMREGRRGSRLAESDLPGGLEVRAERQSIRVSSRGAAAASGAGCFPYAAAGDADALRLNHDVALHRAYSEVNRMRVGTFGWEYRPEGDLLSRFEGAPAEGDARMVVGRWYDREETHLRVGSLPDGRLLYESEARVSWRTSEQKSWLACEPGSAFALVIWARDCVVDLRDLTVRELKGPIPSVEATRSEDNDGTQQGEVDK